MAYEYYDFMKNFKNIYYKLIIPTIVFASIIYIPKLLFHSREISVMKYFYDVFGGISFWFTSTLTISQIILLLLLFIKRESIWPYFLVSILLFATSIYLSDIDTNPFPWYYKSGMGATLFLVLGGIYQHYEEKIEKIGKGKISRLVFLLIYLCCAVYSLSHNPFHYAMISMNINIEGLLLSILGISFIVAVCKYLPNINLFTFIGRHSIVFYFFSGMLPASIGLICQKIFPEKLYVITIAVAVLSICIGLLLTYGINKYAPWLMDIRKLRKQ